MKFLFIKEKQIKGFTLIETIVTLFIISIVMSGIYALINFTLEISNENKHYVEANAIANQKIEQIRNLPYKDVGTISGSPMGIILDEEIIIKNGTYKIETDIEFVDDPIDGEAIFDAGGNIISTSDIVWTDYKKATIRISWNTKRGEREIFISSNIAPPSQEALEGYGLLSISVKHANGNPIQGANINIKNPDYLPNPLDVNKTSDENGQYDLSVLPGLEKYEITVTNGSNYSVDKTHSPIEVLDPRNPHASITESRRTTANFIIDELGHLKIKTVSAALPENFEINRGSSGVSENSKLSIDELGNIYMVWQDALGGIYAQKSDSIGNNWANDVLISADGQSPDICLSDNAFYVSWCDSLGDCYLNKRDEGGIGLWKYKINTVSSSTNAKIFASPTSTDVFTVFQSYNGNDYDIYWRKFDALGNQSSEVLLASNPFEQVSSDIVVDSNNNSYVVWMQYDSFIPDYDTDIYIQKVNENGDLSWNTKVNIDNAYRQYHPAIYLDDDNGVLYIAWTDERNTKKNIYFQQLSTADGGGSPQDTKISVDGSFDQYLPSISGNNSDVYVTWTDMRNGTEDIYSQKINSPWVEDTRVSINAGILNESNSDLAFSIDGSKFIASWDDGENIYFGEVRQIDSAPQSGIQVNIHSSKTIDNPDTIYKYVNNTSVTDSYGEINLDLEWDSVGYVIDIPGRTIEMIDLEPSNRVKLDAGQSQEIIFYLRP